MTTKRQGKHRNCFTGPHPPSSSVAILRMRQNFILYMSHQNKMFEWPVNEHYPVSMESHIICIANIMISLN